MRSAPLTLYRRRIEQGELSPDAAQLNAIRQLDALCHKLVSNQDHGNWFQRLFKPAKASAHAYSPGYSHAYSSGYYLCGGVGSGKTMLMDMFYQSLPEGLGQRIHFHRFMQSVHDRKNKIKGRQNPLDLVAASFASRIKVLCLDEFSVTDIADAMILSGLLDHFFSHGLVLVTTSNTEINNLYRDGFQRHRFLPAIALLKQHTVAIQVDSGNDYRMACLQGHAVFHMPPGARADAALAKCFHQLTGKVDDSAHDNVHGDAQVMTVCGRDIAIVATGSGVVWLEFQALCQTHRSKSDYIEIAKQCHTILLSNIPQLDAALDDAARRFMELVDELYDRNVNLIVSSAHPPENIYTGKRLAEPFKRTASRLTEMSSHEYLAKPHLS